MYFCFLNLATLEHRSDFIDIDLEVRLCFTERGLPVLILLRHTGRRWKFECRLRRVGTIYLEGSMKLELKVSNGELTQN